VAVHERHIRRRHASIVTVAPLTKFVPRSQSLRASAVDPVAGETLVTCGRGALLIREPARPAPRFGVSAFVTSTLTSLPVWPASSAFHRCAADDDDVGREGAAMVTSNR